MTTLLKSDFGKIINTEIQENKVIFEVSLNPDHSIYQGHFPKRPIVPGVCTMQLVRELLQNHLKENLRLIKSKNVKFSGMIDPNITPKVIIEITVLPIDSNHSVQVKASIFSQDLIIFCKFDGGYEREI